MVCIVYGTIKDKIICTMSLLKNIQQQVQKHLIYKVDKNSTVHITLHKNLSKGYHQIYNTVLHPSIPSNYKSFLKLSVWLVSKIFRFLLNANKCIEKSNLNSLPRGRFPNSFITLKKQCKVPNQINMDYLRVNDTYVILHIYFVWTYLRICLLYVYTPTVK